MRLRTLVLVLGLTGILWPAAAGAEAPRKVAGKVFLDANGNGTLDPGEKGLGGVRVTDSIKFVTTGEDGSYNIEASDDPAFPYKPSQVVSVSWPSGKWPTGKWWTRLDAIADAKAVNFGLREDKQDGAFTFAHITDSHSSGGVVENWGKNFPNMAQAVKFAVETGDLGYATFDGAQKMFSDIVSHAATLPVPYFAVPGNHDYVGVHSPDGLKQDPMAGPGAYTKHLGPVRWSFDYAGNHFVGVDFGTSHPGKYEGEPGPGAHEFLKNDLAGAKGGGNLFGFIHYPSIQGGAWRPDKFEHVYVFGGHSHSFACWTAGKITYQTMIALWGAGGCGLVHVDGKEVEFVYRCVGCKWGDWQGMARKGQHLNFCPMFEFAWKLTPQIEKVRQLVAKADPGPLAGGRVVGEAPLEGKNALVELDITPGAAKTMGLRLHGDGRVLSVSWDRTWLTVDGIRLSMPLREWEESVRIRVLIDGKIVRMQVNGTYEVARPLVTAKVKAEAFAEGGQANLTKFEVYRYGSGKDGEPTAALKRPRDGRRSR